MAVYLMLLTAVCAAVVLKLAQLFYKQFQFAVIINKIPGPTAFPIIGNVIEILRVGREGRYEWFRDLSTKYKGGIYRIWLGMNVEVHLTTAETVSVIMLSKNLITKSNAYDFVYPWLGTGLLTSTGKKWHKQRKLITPTFRMDILDEYAVVMSEKAEILKQCITLQLKDNPNNPVDVFDLLTQCTLDIVCEAAMGININAQTDPATEYSVALHSLTIQTMERIFRPWLHADWIYYRTSHGKRFKRNVEIVHKLTNQIFKITPSVGKNCKIFAQTINGISSSARKRIIAYLHGRIHITFSLFQTLKIVVISERKLTREIHRHQNSDVEIYTDKPKRQAFLDHLLDACDHDNILLTDEELREQVDTFLFAGHDTTAAAISWALYCIGNHPDVEEKIHQEQLAVFGDSMEPPTLRQLSELKYLENVMKESLRLFPSVPTIGRHVTEDTEIAGYRIPKNTVIGIEIGEVHRDPKHWPEPDKFDPNRFLPENSHGRHPYAYIPFSAGPRNCIGQKFSVLEQKIVLTAVLRTWRVKSLLKHNEAKWYQEFVLRPQNGIRIHLTPK